MKANITALFLIIFLSGCGPDHPKKSGYQSHTYTDQSMNIFIKEELKKEGVDFYTYEDSGKEAIAIKNKDKKLFYSIVREAFGGPPRGYSGVCYGTKEREKYQLSQLLKNNIPSISRKKDSSYCVYWKKEFSDKVEIFDPSYKIMREREKTMGYEI